MENTSENLSQNVKTVSEFVSDLKNLLENKYPYIWLKGELGPVKVHSSGHQYFSLKEGDNVVNAICWKGTPLGNELKEGAVVECYGRITIYPGRSSYQIIVKDVRQVNQQGDILQQLEALKKKLTEEGLFDSAKKKAIPKFPKKIGILTSPTGAVFHDMMHRINDRYPCCDIYFFPVAVQGTGASESIIQNLKKADTMNLDTVILARGGGSIEDLWVFNDEGIVRQIAAMNTPIISAIGHETDTTLSDYAADLRAPTPTAASEFATPDKKEIQNYIKNVETNIQNIIKEKIAGLKQNLKMAEDSEYTHINNLNNISQKIDHLTLNIINQAQTNVNRLKIMLGNLESPKQIFDKLESQVNEFTNSIESTLHFKIANTKNWIEQTKIFMEEKEIELQEKIIIKDKSGLRLKKTDQVRSANEFTLHFIDGSLDAICKKFE